MTVMTNNFTTPSPFHTGEQDVQTRLGVRDIESWGRKIIRDHMPAQHRDFFVAQPFLVAAGRDTMGHPWATLLEGPDSFTTSPDPRHLEIAAELQAGDPAGSALQEGSELGLLGIEMATRRRNRVNGRIRNVRNEKLVFEVAQSFGNCPQYIRERNWVRVADNKPGEPSESMELSGRQMLQIAQADTFFIATGYQGEASDPASGLDASHRGGERGFIEVTDESTLRFPDYAGNNHFNTLGNLTLDPRIGLLFIDFTTGGLLQLAGRAEIDYDGKDIDRFPGAQRLITIRIEKVVDRPRATALRWDEDAESVRTLVVAEKVQESESVTSFILKARDGGALRPFTAGQHLPIELELPAGNTRVSRSYSLSNAPDSGAYRISVKREQNGLGSRFLHDQVEAGTHIQSRNPAGDFSVADNGRHVILISAGIGITPMMSMLSHLAAAQPGRAVSFVHVARNGAHHPFKNEIAGIAAQSANIRTLTAYTRARPKDRIGIDFDVSGRPAVEHLQSLGDLQAADIYLCGPQTFVSNIHSQLTQAGVDERHINWETF